MNFQHNIDFTEYNFIDTSMELIPKEMNLFTYDFSTIYLFATPDIGFKTEVEIIPNLKICAFLYKNSQQTKRAAHMAEGNDSGTDTAHLVFNKDSANKINNTC